MADFQLSLGQHQNKRIKNRMNRKALENAQARSGRPNKRSRNDFAGRDKTEHDIPGDDISYGFEYESKEVDPDFPVKKPHDKYFDDNQEIQYTDKEIQEFKSLKNVFVNRKQFIRLAKINSPAYKIMQKELEREAMKNSKSKFRKQNTPGTQKDSSIQRPMDHSTNNGENASVKEEDSDEEIDPRMFKAHGKTFTF